MMLKLHNYLFFQLKMFSVLKFEEPEPPEIVSTLWVNERKNFTKQPLYNDTKAILKAIMHFEDPEENWEDFLYEKILFQHGKIIYLCYTIKLNNNLFEAIEQHNVLDSKWISKEQLILIINE